MKREFLINIFFLILINVLIKPIYIFFIETRVQDTLGPNVYGLYFGIFNIAFILQVISDLGIQNYNSRSIAKNPTLLAGYLPKILGLKLFLSLIYLLSGIGIAAILGYLSASMDIFLLVSLNLVLLSMILYLRTNIAATGHYRLDSVISVLDKIFLIIFLSFLLFFPHNLGKFTIQHFILAQTISFSIVLLIVLIINFSLAGLVKISFDLKFSKSLLKRSLPFSLVIILMSLYMRMDGFMLDRLLDDQSFQAGVYAASFRIYEAFNMIGYLFAVLLLPMFASLLKYRKELMLLIKSSHNLMLSIAGAVVVGAVLFRQEIMHFLYPVHATSYYGELLKLLMLSYFAISLSYIYSTYLTAANKLKKLNILLFGGVILNFVFNLVVIPLMGATGAALATIFTQFFVLLGQYLLCVKELGFKTDLMLLFKRLLFIPAIIFSGIMYKRFLSSEHWFLDLLLMEIVLIAISFLFGFIRIKDLKKNPIS